MAATVAVSVLIGVAAASAFGPRRGEHVAGEQQMVPRQAQDHFRAGRPKECLAALEKAVRDDPSCAPTRLFLFQMQSMLGQWDRARTQLRILTDLDATRAKLYSIYDKVLAGEKRRADCLAGKSNPTVPGGDPPPGFAARLALARAITGGGGEDVTPPDHADNAFGRINGADGAPCADANDRFGPFLEAIVDDQYAWIPLDRIARLDTQPPAQLHDLIWLPARIRLADGTALHAFLPTRYPGAESAEDGLICLGRQTDYFQAAPGVQWGLGQRVLVAGTQQVPLLELRTASFAGSAAVASAAHQQGQI